MARRGGKRRTIVFPDDWWARIGELADKNGQTAGDFVRETVYRRIKDPKRPLSENRTRGRPRNR